MLRCDNGPQLACEAIADWAGEHVGLSFIPPGEPWRNGYVESVNGRVRDECLNINIFWSLAQARVVIGHWKDDYNQRRRHSSLGYPGPSHLRCGLYPPMNDSHTQWISSRGLAARLRLPQPGQPAPPHTLGLHPPTPAASAVITTLPAQVR